MKSGGILLIPTVIAQIPFMRSGENVVGTVSIIIDVIQLAVLIGSIVPVEEALKRTFDENGNRR